MTQRKHGPGSHDTQPTQVPSQGTSPRKYPKSKRKRASTLETISIAVRVPPEMRAWLVQEALDRSALTGAHISMSDIIRELISAHIDMRANGLDGSANEMLRQAHDLALGMARHALNEALSSLPASHEEALARIGRG